MYKGKTIGVVIPAYNEEQLIPTTIKSVPKYVDMIYVVNDGSTDGTADIAWSFYDTRIQGINHDKNRGVGAAIVSGYKIVLKDNIDIAVVMAGDLACDKYL